MLIWRTEHYRFQRFVSELALNFANRATKNLVMSVNTRNLLRSVKRILKSCCQSHTRCFSNGIGLSSKYVIPLKIGFKFCSNVAECLKRSLSTVNMNNDLNSNGNAPNWKRSDISNVIIGGHEYKRDDFTNVTPSLLLKLERNLHLVKNHPLEIIKGKIHSHFYAHYRSRYGGTIFAAIDNLSPVVTVEQNFDSLLVPKSHVSRSKNDNYYIDRNIMLRAHTSAHQRDLIKSGWDAFLVTGDVYRRDEIDRSHYPVFHQMEGVRIFGENELFDGYDVSVLEVY